MKLKIKQMLMVIAGLLLSTSAFAHDFSVGGIYYNYLDKTAKTVAVAYSNEYTGSVTIPSSVTYSGTTYSVTSIGYSAFSSCTGLTSITIPNSVTFINSYAFNGCIGLTSVTIPNSVTEIGDYTFSRCTGLTSVTIPNSVTSIGDAAFYNCSGLTSVTIPNSVTSIGSFAFSSCTGLTSITIPNSVTEIGEEAFYYCTGLASITIPNSVTSIGSSAFSSCTGLTSVIVENGNSKYDSRGNCNAIVETSTNTLILGCKNSTIPNSVTSIGDYAFSGCTGLISVTIPNSVTEIGDAAFSSCTGLTSITIPNSVTEIGDAAFSSCTGLTSITIPNSVTEIGNKAFINCSNLMIVINLSNLTFIKGSSSYGYVAYYASHVINDSDLFIVDDFVFYKDNNVNTMARYLGNSDTILLPTDFNGENYVISDFAFYNCSGLTSITIPNSVTSIGYSAFEYCTGLTSITIPNSVTSIGYSAFEYCSGLTELIIEDGKETLSLGYNDIDEGLFYDCPLEKLYLGRNLNYESEWCRYSPFYSKTKLKEVTIGNSVTSIGSGAFYNCSGLTSVTIGSGISSIPSDAFSVNPQKTIWLTNTPPSGYSNVAGTINYVANDQYSSLSNVKVYPYLSSIFEVDGVKYVPVSPSERTCDAIDCTYNPTDTIINIGNTVTFKGVAMTVKEINPYICYGNSHIKECKIDYNGNIPNYAFCGCSSIETITLGNELETIGNSAFESCSKLKEVVIPNSVTYLGTYAFYGCSSLTSATIGNAVENINSSTFYNCKSLENITIGNTVKSIGNNTFYGCSSLPSIEIPKNVTSIGNYAFDNCSKLSNVIIEDRDTVLTLGSNDSSPMFSDCPLDSVYIGGDISYKTTSSYGYSPFYNNKTLRAVTITDKETEISENEFYGCANLKSVSIGDGVETIGKYAFSGCSSLESFAFGTSMKTIGEEAFSDCTALIKLSSKATTPPACGTQALDDINKWNCELIVPDDAISAYQTADQWKEFFFISPNKIDEITTNVNDAIEIARYDIHGRLLSEPTKGINIIKYSDGSTRKEIVKE